MMIGRSWGILLLTMLMTLAAEPVQAHRPYFTRSEMVTLPDGRPGEMRIIAGDGIIAVDPTRLLILDEHGRLLARGPAHNLVDLVCDAPRRCFGYAYGSGEIIEADAASFRANGPQVPALEEYDWDKIGYFESGQDFWGVSVREDSFSEWLICEWVLVKRTSWIILIFFMMLGSLGGA